eukprot:1139617-Pelagomonas_calceolata.AAC.1
MVWLNGHSIQPACKPTTSRLNPHNLIELALSGLLTGSGKTCGFLLPGMMHIKKAGHKDLRQGPQLLVLAPTRELAVQSMLGGYSMVGCWSVYARTRSGAV